MTKVSSNYIKTADDIFSKLIRKKGLCIRCGRSQFNTPIECAHIIGRSNIPLRWDANNAVPLCLDCHRWGHANPRLFMEWFENKFPDRYAYITLHKNDVWRLQWYDYESMIKMFREYAKKSKI